MTNYQYPAADTKFEITAEELLILRQGVLDGKMATVKYEDRPAIFRFVNVKTGKTVKAPSKAQLEAREVIQEVDYVATLANENSKMSFTSHLTPAMIDSEVILSMIHQRNIDAGIAVPVTQEDNG